MEREREKRVTRNAFIFCPSSQMRFGQKMDRDMEEGGGPATPPRIMEVELQQGGWYPIY
jgi:hypothetical protein